MKSKIFEFGKTIQKWLSQFAPTYRGILPSGETPADLYLRHDGYFDNFATSFIYPIQIYKTNTTSYSSVLLVADEIESAIGDSGVVISDSDDMIVHIEKGSPFYQDKADENNTVRAGYINLIVSIYCVSRETKILVKFINEVTNEIKENWVLPNTEIEMPENEYDYLDDYFYGWTDGENTYKPKDKYTIKNKDVVFTVVWQNLEKWTVTFVANGEVVGTANYDYLHRNITIPQIPEIYGYIGAWEKFDMLMATGDFTVNATYTPRPEILLSGTINADEQIIQLRREGDKND